MKVYTYRVGSRRLRATSRLSPREMRKGRFKRPWAAYKHRELLFYLIGLTLILMCVLPIPIYYWQRMQAAHEFAADAARGKALLSQVEEVVDRGRSILMPCATYDYGDPLPTSGSYDPDWIEAGFYDSPRAPTLLVHALARGSVVIYYDNPQGSVVETLKDWAGLFHGDRDGIVIVPHPGLGSEIVLTAWDKRLRLPHFDPAVAAAFIDAFRGRGPEKRVR